MKQLSILVCLLLLAQISFAQTFYVATNGNDKNAGTLDKPFATIDKAKEAVRQLKKSNAINEGGVTVFIRGGDYQINSSIEFGREDGGNEGKPIIYKAYENETPHLVNATMIAANKWKPLQKEALKRVHPKVNASKLVEIDISGMGFKNTKQFAPTNQFTTDWFIIDLFANNQRQPISQWPNLNENIRGKNDPGWTTCNGSKDNHTFYYGANGKPQDKDTVNELDLDGTHRSNRWAKTLQSGHEIWLKGLWRVPWEPRTHKMKEIDTTDNSISLYEAPPQGMGSKYSAIANEKPQWRTGNGKENWFALNLLEEIDQSGEWALDIKDQKIYYYPPAPIGSLKMMVSDAREPVIKLSGADNVQIIGLTIEGGLGTGIEMQNSSHVLIAGCNIQNVGNSGISINGGSFNTILSNEISQTGGWGIELKNIGNRKNLLSGNVAITNNHIHHIGKLAFKEAIIIVNAVGVIVAHNLLHDTPKGTIRTDDINNCVFEYNEIHNIALKEGDTGVFYNYGGWSTYGNIFRYNFSHHTNRANGFYSDDGDSGDFYYNNIVQGCLNGVLFGGGHDVIAENNLFVQSKGQSIDDRGKDRNYRLGTRYETNLTKFDITKSPWKEYGEKLQADQHLTTNLWADILNPELHPELPNGSRMKDNVAVASGKFVKRTGNVEVSNNTTIATITDAAFYDYTNMDLRTNNQQILDKFPTLNTIFPLIGLQVDSYRKTIPSRKETGGLGNGTSGENVDTEDKMVDKIKATQKKG